MNKQPINTIPIPPPYKGQWFPVSVAAHLSGYSRQWINRLVEKEQVRVVRFPYCPTLISMDDLRGSFKKAR